MNAYGGVVAGKQGKKLPPPGKFWAVKKLSENLLVQKFSSKM